MNDKKVRFSFYLPQSMIDKLRKDATESDRSANGQLMWIIKKHYDQEEKKRVVYKSK